ncbi:2-succinyl-5-enolpyruvyl-6-hydroxy-3-cyclohexene-1-carboxylic-acid synthase [Vibrio panuliri]|uniref:2-succinyl-5-enolpyruvyl-6-hydroxy-3-cyclohexene-1-carboxylate synthase n=1 Tax=Vibrio panuliri TaxID=1381081 RepID=A0ABX3F7Y4_9VIBR|nr:2-succinyl-5-enolpyruvyl-6-hydroxy-3-cyclohexene-1-carboxylic-acid synthase [Vibrio panuliri]KAB1454002.1 2-succinyl-5-enolpyruvyl-6-hydroxy-3-cyclohexene-1-carboxylic-acid synthase [Vibrio panuliri]OLQ84416.1 2-succinyl-5-enolpyruvyl-6-hydroxy-3-cyclohexene-1-carboxylic-acid synthase [Vibrio panuliri]
MHDQAVLNRIWCQTLLEELTRFGVEQVCVAPGSRSTPLTLEADANSKLTIHTHFDERGLGFLALGMAKASQKPVAVIVTSGTAVANLLPAIAEAKLTGEKLVVLTADRPVELVGCGANQAIVQAGIYSSHVCAELALPSPSQQVPLRWLLTSIDDVMHQQAREGSAIHINCAFPEPLYSDQAKSLYQDYLDSVAHWQQSGERYTEQYCAVSTPWFDVSQWQGRKGLIIVGSVSKSQAELAKKLAEKLAWPVLCDPQSGASSDWAYYDAWLQTEAGRRLLNQADLVLQIGSRIVAKRFNQWLAQADVEYHYVSPSAARNNQDHRMQIHHLTDITSWLNQSLSHQWRETGKGWAEFGKQLSDHVAQSVLEQTHQDSRLTEMALATSLVELPADTDVFLGNSLFVRMVDMFGRVESEVYSNRGASGIDGLVATAAGTMRISDKPSVLYIGDTSLLYDLNSLALFTQQQTPCVIVVTNNDGGAIFDLLPVPQAQKQSLYQMPHGYDFAAAAQQFKLAYHRVTTLAEYQTRVEQHLTQGRGCLLVEVQTPPEQASQQIKAVIQNLHARL